MQSQWETDVVIIGAGVTGTTLARELSRYKVDAIVVDKGGDAGSQGQTKAAGGMIYTGLIMLMSFILKSVMAPDAPLYDPDSQKVKWLEQGFDMAAQWLEELDVEYHRLTTMVVATNTEEVKALESLVKFGESIGTNRYASARWADSKMCSDMEPHLTKDVVASLYSEGDLMHTQPWDIAIAQAENARQNGIRFMFDTEVTGVLQKNGYQIVETSQGPIKTRFIVNAAGIFADVVADMGGARDWGLAFVRNLPTILDKRTSRLVNTCLNRPPVPGKGPICYRTLDGNVKIETGPYVIPRDRYDTGAYPGELIQNLLEAKRYIPEISEKDVIRTFVGMRVFNTRDQEENIIEPCSTNPRFINAAVRLPGIIPALPIARHLVKMLGDAGLELTTNPDFNPFRTAIPRFRNLSESERNKLIAKDPRYGHVVCRCETITEGEIVEAIKRGARTVAGVRYVTRAGMGRCQGGFCGPRVVGILARELNIPVTQVMESGLGSPIVPFESKELLREAARVGA
ncbi:MAG TPA: FAD-dependent oxidoreductase [Dehalococcoidia bacterium]|nr:FAD-dependent oxidoreductase [Dehalococcoidia bacterium]